MVKSTLRLLIITTLVFTPTWAKANTSNIKCETADDLDFESCNPDNLPIDELKVICESIGLNTEDDVFPHIFHDDEGSPVQKKIHTQEDYAKAAYECILVADETEHHFDHDMLDDHPELMAEIVTEVMGDNPSLIGDLVLELKKDDPALWGSIAADLASGQTLTERPEIISELVHAMIDQDLIGIEFEDDEYYEDEEL